MSNLKIKLNIKGISDLMKSPEIQAVVHDAGEAVAAAASGMSNEDYAAADGNPNEDYAAGDAHLAKFVAISNVYPNSKSAAKDNYDNNTLLKAIGEAGLPQQKPHL